MDWVGGHYGLIGDVDVKGVQRGPFHQSFFDVENLEVANVFDIVQIHVQT